MEPPTAIEVLYTFDASDTRQLVGYSEAVFSGRTVRLVGEEPLTSTIPDDPGQPQQQWEVEVSEVLKGEGVRGLAPGAREIVRCSAALQRLPGGRTLHRLHYSAFQNRDLPGRSPGVWSGGAPLNRVPQGRILGVGGDRRFSGRGFRDSELRLFGGLWGSGLVDDRRLVFWSRGLDSRLRRCCLPPAQNRGHRLRGATRDRRAPLPQRASGILACSQLDPRDGGNGNDE